MDNKTLTDILLICKGWYDKTKYKNILEALNGYYHKYYGCEDIVMDKAFANRLFLQPLVLEAVNRDPKLARYLFEPSYSIIDNNENFVDVMYDRLIGLIQMIEHNTFDLSEYQEMFNEYKYYNSEDKVEYYERLGVI